MKHQLNSKGQAETTADACKKAENLMSNKPIANCKRRYWLQASF